MRPILTDQVAWSVGLSVGLSVTLVSPAKTAAPIELPFGLRTLVGPGKHVLDRRSRIFDREWASHCKVYGHSTVVCAKTAEPIQMPFGLWARIGTRNYVIDGSPEMLRNVAIATNFGTEIAITGFVRTIATRQLAMQGV